MSSKKTKHLNAQPTNGNAVSQGAATLEKANVCYVLHFSADRQKIAVKYQNSHELGDIVSPLSAGYGFNEKPESMYNETLRRYYGERVTLISIGEKNYKTFRFTMKVDQKKTLNVYVLLIYNLYAKGINANTSFRKLDELAAIEPVMLCTKTVDELGHDITKDIEPKSSAGEKIHICGHDCAVAQTFAETIKRTMAIVAVA